MSVKRLQGLLQGLSKHDEPGGYQTTHAKGGYSTGGRTIYGPGSEKAHQRQPFSDSYNLDPNSNKKTYQVWQHPKGRIGFTNTGAMVPFSQTSAVGSGLTGGGLTGGGLTGGGLTGGKYYCKSCVKCGGMVSGGRMTGGEETGGYETGGTTIDRLKASNLNYTATGSGLTGGRKRKKKTGIKKYATSKKDVAPPDAIVGSQAIGGATKKGKARKTARLAYESGDGEMGGQVGSSKRLVGKGLTGGTSNFLGERGGVSNFAGERGGVTKNFAGEIGGTSNFLGEKGGKSKGKPLTGGKGGKGTKKGSSTNPWLTHIAQVRAATPGLSYKEAMVKAKASYNK